MKVEIKVPAMGESISEATVGTLLKPSGSKVSLDDELLELETDKVNQVLYAQQPGVVSFVVAPGDVVKIGQVIGTIDSAGVGAPAEAKPEAKPEAKKAVPKAAPAPTPAPETGGARVSREQYLEQIQAEPKVESKAAPKAEKPAEKAPAAPIESFAKGRQETRRKMSKIRQVIAKRMVEAQHNAAMLTTFNEVDMSQVIALREKYKELFIKEHGVKLGFMSFFVKAVVTALMEFPDINSYLDGDEIVHREYYDIGIAVGTDRGVIVPVVRDCDHLSFAQIEKSIEGYAKKVREGGIVVDDLQGGGFTITNGGVYGSLLSTPILNPPQSGILGMHNIVKRAVVVGDQIVIRPMMYLALSYDHRIVDGKAAVSFLVTVKNCLEDPARLQLEV